MKKIYRNGLLMLVAGAFAASCANYDIADDFCASPDPSYSEPYKDYAPVKTYIDRSKYANMTLGATLKVAEFNKQELAHAAAMTNFDNLAFGSTLMSGTIINDKGMMNFLDMMDLLDHVEEVGGEVFGSPIAANTNQPEGWLNTLTAPIEVEVSTIKDKDVDYTTMDEFTGAYKEDGPKPEIVKNFEGNQNALMCPKKSELNIVEGFDVDLSGSYTITFYAKSIKNESLFCTFADSLVKEKDADAIGKKFPLKPGEWAKIVVEAKPSKNATTGYLKISNIRNNIVYIKNVSVVHTPDNHRPQTAQEMRDTVSYAFNAWCDGLMKVNKGRITSFDLIDEPIDVQATLENGYYDLKHSEAGLFWQDVFGGEDYAPTVSKIASETYQKYEGDASKLRLFISENGLEDQKKFESLKYWINIWDGKGAKIDGINVKLNLVYSEDSDKQAANETSLNNLFDNLASTGKLIRLSDFDIKYQNASGANVSATRITVEQRQRLADYYGHVIKSYMTKIPQDKQAGICKGNMADTSDPVGLWTVDGKSWIRNATYKSFCDALSGK